MKISALEKYDQLVRHWLAEGKTGKQIAPLLEEHADLSITARSVQRYIKKHGYKRLDKELLNSSLGSSESAKSILRSIRGNRRIKRRERREEDDLDIDLVALDRQTREEAKARMLNWKKE